MKILQIHRWDLILRQAVAVQESLRRRVGQKARHRDSRGGGPAGPGTTECPDRLSTRTFPSGSRAAEVLRVTRRAEGAIETFVLSGQHHGTGRNRGASVFLIEEDEILGAVVWPRDWVKPKFVSVGPKLSLPNAVDLVLEYGGCHRLCISKSLAHQAAPGTLQSEAGTF